MPESSPEARSHAGPAAAFLLAVLIAFAGIGSHSLWSPDEPTGAAVGRGMLDSGDLIVPRLNGEPFLEKPPLYWWVQVAAFRVFGITDAVARVPSALFSMLTLMAAYATGRRLGGARQGMLALVVLGTTVVFVQNLGRVVVDPALTFFVALAHLGFVVLAEPRSPSETRWARLLIAVAIPLGFLSKGVVAIGLGAGPPVLYLLATRRGRVLRELMILAAIGLATFALLVTPWALALYHAAGWAGLKECLVANTASRFAHTSQSARFGHTQPIYYYLIQTPLQLLPWALALPAMWRAGVFRRDTPGSEVRRLLLATVVIGILLLSAASSKREMYLMPLIPAWSVCVAWWLAGAGENGSERAWDRRTLLTLLGFASGVFLLLGALSLWVGWALHLPATLAPVQAVVSKSSILPFGGMTLWIGVALAILLVRWRQTGPPVVRVAIAMVLLFLVLQTAVQALIDPVKEMDRMTSEVAWRNRFPGPVPAYLPPGQSNEVVFGMIGFKLGRGVLPLTRPEELRTWFAARPQSAVLARASQARKLPPELQRELLFAWDETGRKASPYALLIPNSPPRKLSAQELLLELQCIDTGAVEAPARRLNSSSMGMQQRKKTPTTRKASM
ncbi:MAG TPA: glycosyltransferase family 39 protein [Thermoanaerobaculia bacterium]|jgi:4-amino-4-deoxy-L-arabinose transferase-like glycosyltransferase|nr:glycosyltransferase family 39 protein [Thermoanaerobaculia bacterium]